MFSKILHAWRWTRGHWAQFGLVFATLLLCLGVMEAGLRLAGLSYPSWVQLDPKLGWSFRPNTQGWFTREGRAYVHINSAGYNAPEFAFERDPDTLRVAILGDSFTAAMQVDQTENFASRLQAKLSACLSGRRRGVAVYPFGTNGYNTVQQLLMFRERVAAYRPDIVILAAWPANDLWENMAWGVSSPFQPHASVRDGALAIDRTALKSEAFARERERVDRRASMINAFRVVQIFKEAWVRLSPMLRSPSGDNPPPAAPAVNIYMAPEADKSGKLAAAWRVMDAAIAALADSAEEIGATLYVAPLSDPTQAEPDPAKRKTAMAALGVRSLSYPSQRLRLAADRAGAGFIPVAQSVADQALASNTAFHRFDGEIINGHYNAAGHEAVAAAMADTLCR